MGVRSRRILNAVALHTVQQRLLPFTLRFKKNALLNRSWARWRCNQAYNRWEQPADSLEADEPPSLPQSGRGRASISFTISKMQARPLGEEIALPMAMQIKHQFYLECGRALNHKKNKMRTTARDTLYCTAASRQDQIPELHLTFLSSLFLKTSSSTASLSQSMPVLNSAYSLLHSSNCLKQTLFTLI